MSLRGSAYRSSPRPRQMWHIPEPLHRTQSVLLFRFPSVLPVPWQSWQCPRPLHLPHEEAIDRIPFFPCSAIVLRTSQWSLSALPIHRAGTFGAITANLLVVNLLVKPYKPKRGESREILPRSRYQGTGTSEEACLLSGGHDLFRIFCSSLAADRGRSPHHGYDPSAHLRSVRNLYIKIGAGFGCWHI
jgi:hypothetical protein